MTNVAKLEGHKKKTCFGRAINIAEMMEKGPQPPEELIGPPA